MQSSSQLSSHQNKSVNQDDLVTTSLGGDQAQHMDQSYGGNQSQEQHTHQNGQIKIKKIKQNKKHHNISMDNAYDGYIRSELKIKKNKKVSYRNRQSLKGQKMEDLQLLNDTDYNADFDQQSQAQGLNSSQQNMKISLKNNQQARHLSITLENGGRVTEMKGNLQFQTSFDKRENQNQSLFQTLNQEEMSGRLTQLSNLKNKNKFSNQLVLKEVKLPKVLKNFQDRTPTNMMLRQQTPHTTNNSPYQSPKNSSPISQLKKGQDMYQTIKKEKETNLHLALMENRIKKLEDEQLRAQRKIQETIERTQRYQKIQEFKNIKYQYPQSNQI